MHRIAIDRRPPTWLLLALSGVILGLAYPPNPVGLFGSIGLVPLLVALERAESTKKFFRWSYSSLLLFSALSTWWVGSWQAKADPFLMISCILLVLIHPLFFVVPLLIYRAVRRRTSLLFALAFLPFLWCGGEYLHTLGDASYPWLTLGNTQTYNLYFVQFIEFTGVWGLSFVLMVHNVAFTAMVFALDGVARDQAKIFRICSTLLAVTLVLPFLYGFYVLGQDHPSPPERVAMVTIVQPNVDPWDKWKTTDTTDHIRLNSDLSRLSVKGLTPPDLFLWSENAIPYPFTAPDNVGRKAQVQRAVDSLGVPVLTGFPDYREYNTSTHPAPPSAKIYPRARPDGGVDTISYDHFNSAGLIVPGKGIVGAYHKMQLVPFGERIPFVDNVPWLMSALSWNVGISTWGKGEEIVTFSLPLRDATSTRVATVICFESVYPNIVREFVAQGAEFLTVITNDGWYMGTPGPRQHERFAQLRAIETRRAVARSANTGISCFINPYGQITGETSENRATTLTGGVELRRDLTIYVRWGDWWPQFSLGVALLMMGYAWVRGRRRRKP